MCRDYYAQKLLCAETTMRQGYNAPGHLDEISLSFVQKFLSTAQVLTISGKCLVFESRINWCRPIYHS